jgi:hypothetical protein
VRLHPQNRFASRSAKAIIGYDIYLASNQLLDFLFPSDEAEQVTAMLNVKRRFPLATEPNTASSKFRCA